MWNEIAEKISQATGKSFAIQDRRSVGGGCINQGYVISDGTDTYFIKFNRASEYEMFAAEALGLKEMYETKTIRIPQPICWGTTDSSAYIVMEWLELGRGGGSEVWKKMGEQLAQMHRKGMAEKFGWHRNNTIGSTPQINTWTENWADFFAEHRIGYQLRLAKRRGGNYPDPNKVVERVREILADHHPQPSLVHGDLWGGNAEVTKDGEPVILDPATYYGDREVDIAMSELFGGFPAGFYQGYNATWELDSGYQQRKDLYNLYHILNHFNLFGGGYGSQARRIIERLML
ncbi:MAG: fructosamine kinase family protein [Chroococcales cyanobacterium]